MWSMGARVKVADVDVDAFEEVGAGIAGLGKDGLADRPPKQRCFAPIDLEAVPLQVGPARRRWGRARCPAAR